MKHKQKRPVLMELQRFIISGKIVSLEKVNSLPVGKVHITAGKYQTAVPTRKRFAIFIRESTTGMKYTLSVFTLFPTGLLNSVAGISCGMLSVGNKEMTR